MNNKTKDDNFQDELFISASVADAAGDDQDTVVSEPEEFTLVEDNGGSNGTCFPADAGNEDEPAETQRRLPPGVNPPGTHGVPRPRRSLFKQIKAEKICGLGEELRQLRNNQSLSLPEISAETRIKEEYILALEAEDFSRLPALVYVSAYLRKLCELYKVPAAETDAMVALLKENLTYEVPDQLVIKVIDRETDEAELRKLNQIAFGIVAAAVLIVAVLTVGVIMLISGAKKGNPSTFNEESLLDIQEKPVLNVSVLPLK